MPRMMVAASPVEIEAKAAEAGFPQDAHDVARQLFHDLTDRVSQAAVALERLHEDWPNHRFYFGTPGGEMQALLDGLAERPDMLDASGVLPRGGTVAGLYAQARQGAFVGVLVAHEDREGQISGA